MGCKDTGVVAVECLNQAYRSGELWSKGDIWCIERYRRPNPFDEKMEPAEVYPISISETHVKYSRFPSAERWPKDDLRYSTRVRSRRIPR
jgi:hypothetical protein